MITTRARNGIIHTREAPPQQEDHELDGMPEDVQEDAESECASAQEPFRKKLTDPVADVRPAKASNPNKRQKTAKPGTGSKVAGRQRRKDLSLLPTMPTDVIFEVSSRPHSVLTNDVLTME